MRKLAAYDGAPSIVLGLRMLMLTACRPGEVRGARWVEFDRKAALWTIPAERMKMREEHRVPLSKQALEVLDKIEAISGVRELVFPSPYYPSKPLSENTFNSALARMGYKSIATAHGFRALFSTVAKDAPPLQVRKVKWADKRAALDSIMKAQGWNKSDVGTAENPLVIRDMTDAERAVRMSAILQANPTLVTALAALMAGGGQQ